MRHKVVLPVERIAQCIIDGKTNKEIASVLDKSKRTVDDYMHRLLSMYNCKNRAQLANKILQGST